ncbi:MAG: hypothetical protein NTX13_07515 [Acidobacteria bacterium]|nr:hypothetical protein [Acidobacteriota bacterium]
MAKYEITKSIDVDELNKRSGLPTGKKRTLAFGAIIADRVEVRDMDRFTYLGEPYRTKTAELNDACRLIAEDLPSASNPALTSTPALTIAPDPVIAPAPTPVKPAARLQWEPLSSSIPASRAKVPGGWLISITNGGMTFYPDPNHSWDGASL